MDAKPTTPLATADATRVDAPPRPRWVPTVATIVAVVVFVAAGNWQRGRMMQKEALRAQYEAAQRAPASSLPQGDVDWSAWRYRPVEVVGHYEAQRQVLLDNRVHQGRVGYHVMAPLRLADGRAVLVDRGWVAAGASRSVLPPVPVPSGDVTIRGRIALPVAAFSLGRDAPTGNVIQHLDPVHFQLAMGLAVAPVYIEQAKGDVDDGLVRDWPEPDFGIDKHRIYMIQWYLFATLAAGLWLWFAVVRPRLPRERSR